MNEPRRAADGSPPGGAAAGGRRTGERLVALLAAGVVALNFPLLSVFRGRRLLAGIPVLYLYLFLVWSLLAAGTAFVLRTRPPGPREGGGRDEPEEF